MIPQTNGFYIKQTRDKISISEFVFALYQRVFGPKYQWGGNYYSDIRMDDIKYANDSIILVAYPNDEYEPAMILGTIRAIFKKDGKPLPIEKDFKINCEKILLEKNEFCQVDQIAEIARFATNHALSQDLQISPQHVIALDLIKELIYLLEVKKIKFCFASIDEKVFQWFKQIGLPWQIIEEKKFYKGSPTLPALIKMSEIKDNMKIHNPKL